MIKAGIKDKITPNKASRPAARELLDNSLTSVSNPAMNRRIIAPSSAMNSKISFGRITPNT